MWAPERTASLRRATARRGGSRLIPRRRERTDLVVGAVAAGAPRRCGVEAPGADAGRRRLDGVDRPVDVAPGRRVPADDVRVDEAQLEALGQRAGHLLPRQRVHLQLEALGHAAVGVLLAVDLGRVVVDDDRAQKILVHPIVSPAHEVGAEREAKVFLDPGGYDALHCLCVSVTYCCITCTL